MKSNKKSILSEPNMKLKETVKRLDEILIKLKWSNNQFGYRFVKSLSKESPAYVEGVLEGLKRGAKLERHRLKEEFEKLEQLSEELIDSIKRIVG